MSFPSSPPSLRSERLLSSSPPLPPTYRVKSKKRRLSGSVGLSSDPLFSEDASDCGLAEGQNPRRKRLVKGPWWMLSRRKSAGDPKHDLEKRGLQVVDSGVWMASDESEHDRMSIGFSSESDLPEAAQYMAVSSRVRREPVLSHQDIATRTVLSALENGKESIDLSGLSLGSITDDMLRPLHQLIRQPQEHGAFRPLTPAIQLYLAGNNLTNLPRELFKLKNIVVLSIRNNHLRKLPSALFRLPQIEELNVSGNELSFLPWEALLRQHDLSSYKLLCAPNPFYTLGGDLDGTMSLAEPAEVLLEQSCAIYRKHESRRTHFVASSTITYYNNYGAPVTDLSASSRIPSRVSSSTPSLFELALRQAQNTDALSEAIATLPSYVPSGIIDALQAAATSGEIANERCSTCGRETVIPRAQWIEFWADTASLLKRSRDDCLPYMRKACSYVCAKPTKPGGYIEAHAHLAS